MSVAARWSRRLPRAGTRSLETGIAKQTIRRLEQRRWVQRPATGKRAWATMPQKGNNEDSAYIARRQAKPQDNAKSEHQQEQQENQVGRNTQLAAALAQSDSADLVAPVHIPPDPSGVLPPRHPALSILGNSSLVIQRQLEMMNVMLGFEQANRYIIMDGQGNTVGYIAERDHGIGSAVARQMFRTHRSFTTYIFDAQEREVLRIHRPFAYINSRIWIFDPVPEGGYEGTEASTALQGMSASSATAGGGAGAAQISPLKQEDMRIIGEAKQQWAPLRRKYNLFTFRPAEVPSEELPRIESGEKAATDTMALTERKLPEQAVEAGMAQFAHVNEPFLSWDFTLRDEQQNAIGSVNRNFVGFARELFTDTGVYALRMDSVAQTTALENADGQELGRYEKEATAMTLDQRAVMLATAVSIDFDYFSRHSHAGGHGFMPIFWPMGGGAAEAGAGAGAGAAGGAGAGEAGAAGVGTAVGGAAEGAAGAVGGAAARGAAGTAAESGMVGAGTMAGYEAMQRGAYGSRGGAADDASPQAPNDPYPGAAQSPEQAENRPGNDEVWGEDQDPWGGGGSPPSTGGEGGSGWVDSISDFFNS